MRLITCQSHTFSNLQIDVRQVAEKTLDLYTAIGVRLDGRAEL